MYKEEEIDRLSHKYAREEAKNTCGFKCSKCSTTFTECAHYDAFYSYKKAFLENGLDVFIIRGIEKCAIKGTERNTSFGYVYFINKIGTDEYKIGMTKNIETRMGSIKSASGNEVGILAHVQHGNAIQLESTLHEKYHKYRKLGEWFIFPKEMVCSVVEEINSYAIDAIRG